LKAIQLDRSTRQRTGRDLMLRASTRLEAVEELLATLGLRAEDARVDSTRTLVEVAGQLWTLVASPASDAPAVSPSLRRAGAKHRRVR
jgi:hypothetical protein